MNLEACPRVRQLQTTAGFKNHSQIQEYWARRALMLCAKSGGSRHSTTATHAPKSLQFRNLPHQLRWRNEGVLNNILFHRWSQVTWTIMANLHPCLEAMMRWRSHQEAPLKSCLEPPSGSPQLILPLTAVNPRGIAKHLLWSQ